MFLRVQCSLRQLVVLIIAITVCSLPTLFLLGNEQASIADLETITLQLNSIQRYPHIFTHNNHDKIINTTKSCTVLNPNSNWNSNNNMPLWSDLNAVNMNFGVLYFPRVPKTGTRTWKDRNYKLAGYLTLRTLMNNTSKYDNHHMYNQQQSQQQPQLIFVEQPHIHQNTFVGVNLYQKFAIWPVDEDTISQWSNSFFHDAYYVYLEKLIENIDFTISQMIKNNISSDSDNTLRIMDTSHVTTYAHFPFIDNFDKLNNLWFDYLSRIITEFDAKNPKLQLNYVDVEIQVVKSLLQQKFRPFQERSEELQGNVNLKLNIAANSLHSIFNLQIPKAKLRVTWIIYIRDPITHQISRFDFWREIFKVSYQTHPIIYNMTFEQCVDALEWKQNVTMLSIDKQSKIRMQRNSSSMMDEYLYNPCHLSINYFTRWLCGIGNDCRKLKLDNQSLTRAILNLNEYFDFVGVVEYYEQSWKFLTMKFPIFGVKKSLKLPNTEEHRKNSHKPMSHATLHKLTQWSYLDIKLYNYVRTRFETCILPHV